MSPFMSYAVARARIQHRLDDAAHRRFAARAQDEEKREPRFHVIKDALGLRLIAMGERLVRQPPTVSAGTWARTTAPEN
jgi:hypothetical protein